MTTVCHPQSCKDLHLHDAKGENRNIIQIHDQSSPFLSPPSHSPICSSILLHCTDSCSPAFPPPLFFLLLFYKHIHTHTNLLLLSLFLSTYYNSSYTTYFMKIKL